MRPRIDDHRLACAGRLHHKVCAFGLRTQARQEHRIGGVGIFIRPECLVFILGRFALAMGATHIFAQIGWLRADRLNLIHRTKRRHQPSDPVISTVETALKQLVPLVEAELRRLARGYMRRERQGHTLQATALVNEVFLRLTDAGGIRWQDRAHFLGIASRLMRRVLVDYARSRGYRKRGGEAQRVTLDDTLLVTPEPAVDVMALDRALDVFARIDARKSRVVELKFFGGLSLDDTAQALGLSRATVERDWQVARNWLYRRLNTGSGRHDA